MSPPPICTFDVYVMIIATNLRDVSHRRFFSHTARFIVGFCLALLLGVAGVRAEGPAFIASVTKEHAPSAVHRGMSRSEVFFTVGSPTARLSSELWLYANCGAKQPELNDLRLDTIVVLFERDHVVQLKFVKWEDIKMFIARRTTSGGSLSVRNGMPAGEASDRVALVESNK